MIKFKTVKRKVNEGASAKNFIENFKNRKYKLEVNFCDGEYEDKITDEQIKASGSHKFLTVSTFSRYGEDLMELFHIKFKAKMFTKKNTWGLRPQGIILIPTELHDKVKEFFAAEGFESQDRSGAWNKTKVCYKALTHDEFIALMESFDATF